jgi:hypothetical protein
MRRSAIVITAALVCVGFAGAQGSQDEARAILEKAIKAEGGEATLKKFKAATIKLKGRVEAGGGIDINQTIRFLLPGKFREEVSFEVNGMAINTVTIFDGKKGVLLVNDKEVKIDKLDDALREASQMIEAFQLLPFRAKGYELTAVGEAQVNGKPAIGLRVSKKGQPDLTLHFDKESYLLVKAQHRTVDPTSGMEMDQERIVTEYKKVDGAMQPGKVQVNRDGKKFLEAEVTEYKRLESLDDGLFKLP